MASISSSAANAAAASDLVAGAEHVAHALEVLVDAHAHQLDLEAELVELVVEAVPHRLAAVGERQVSRSGPVT